MVERQGQHTAGEGAGDNGGQGPCYGGLVVFNGWCRSCLRSAASLWSWLCFPLRGYLGSEFFGFSVLRQVFKSGDHVAHTVAR